MKRILLIISALCLTNCFVKYTVHNDTGEEVTVGGVKLSPDDCVEFSDIFSSKLSLLDFPLEIQNASGELLEDEEGNTSFRGNYYVVNEGVVVAVEADEACMVEEVSSATDLFGDDEDEVEGEDEAEGEEAAAEGEEAAAEGEEAVAEGEEAVADDTEQVESWRILKQNSTFPPSRSTTPAATEPAATEPATTETE